eukprot:6805179-Pyramimonas_sp.AAC.1
MVGCSSSSAPLAPPLTPPPASVGSGLSEVCTAGPPDCFCRARASRSRAAAAFSFGREQTCQILRHTTKNAVGMHNPSVSVCFATLVSSRH